jgi:uncharacterized membrane protein YhaH (DUF805 family)
LAEINDGEDKHLAIRPSPGISHHANILTALCVLLTQQQGSVIMNFGDSIKTCFNKYTDFNGRAARPEFWWFVLFTFLATLVLGMVSHIVSGLFSLAVIVPSLAVGARRLHDTNRSGWWQLVYLIPLIGLIVMIVFCVQEGDSAGNQYGEVPEN